jgi:hypothetical protein
MVEGMTQSGAKGKTSGVLDAAKQALTGSDDDDDDDDRRERRPARRSSSSSRPRRRTRESEQ